jgi:hypothetical protein
MLPGGAVNSEKIWLNRALIRWNYTAFCEGNLNYTKFASNSQYGKTGEMRGVKREKADADNDEAKGSSNDGQEQVFQWLLNGT